MKVLKFGGSSLADANRYLNVSEIVRPVHQDGGAAVVLSAPQGVTNALSLLVEQASAGQDFRELLAKLKMKLTGIADDLAAQLDGFKRDDICAFVEQLLEKLQQQLAGIQMLGCAPEQITAQILSLGEYVSVRLFSQILTAQGIQNDVIDPVDYVVAEGDYLDSLADMPATIERFNTYQPAAGTLVIMPGFVAANRDGEKVTLGRNGSDYSAAILAAGLHADCCEIWTDVDGVYNADPREVENAVLLDKLTYQEAMELSYFGAKVLHPKTIGPIAQHHIPCKIKNTLNPQAPGTLISNEKSTRWTSVKGISHLENLTMINVAGPGMKGMVGMASRIFKAISAANISIVLITQSSSEYSISFCVYSKDAQRAELVLQKEFELELSNQLLEHIELRADLAIVSLVGDGMRKHTGLAARFFSALAQARVNVVAIAQGSSERSISAVIESDKAREAVRTVHQSFFSDQHTIDLFLIGCGTVGGELLNQIARQQEKLAKKNIRLRVYGIANSRRMLLAPEGIDLHADWRSQLAEANARFSVETLKDFVQQNSLINPVLVDCTTSEQIAELYIELMLAGLHVVTPNKKANTAGLSRYKQLRETALDTRRQFLYETTVGAGLPVIENLQKLIYAGDKLIRFEGILSGSLSFIFGKLEEGMSLSEATAEARKLGYTEPDPRDDLSGMDVARKLLIMARESGMQLELSDIHIEPVLPASFDAVGTVDHFMQNLPGLDAHFSARISAAASEGKVLRYVGRIEEGQCSVAIIAVDEQHPLYAVKDGENALAIHSRYYSPKPFVIRGYGAGAQVTAAGVFADIMRTMPWKQEL